MKGKVRRKRPAEFVGERMDGRSKVAGIEEGRLVSRKTYQFGFVRDYAFGASHSLLILDGARRASPCHTRHH